MDNLTDEQVDELLKLIESPEEAQEPPKPEPEEAQGDSADELKAKIAKLEAENETLRGQNKRMFDSMSKMVNRIPVSNEPPKPPETDEQKREKQLETYDFKKLDFT